MLDKWVSQIRKENFGQAVVLLLLNKPRFVSLKNASNALKFGTISLGTTATSGRTSITSATPNQKEKIYWNGEVVPIGWTI